MGGAILEALAGEGEVLAVEGHAPRAEELRVAYADRGVEVAQDLGQRERHDRRVGQHETHRDGEQQCLGVTHHAILPAWWTGCASGRDRHRSAGASVARA